jgi:hypothetical protein
MLAGRWTRFGYRNRTQLADNNASSRMGERTTVLRWCIPRASLKRGPREIRAKKGATFDDHTTMTHVAWTLRIPLGAMAGRYRFN